MRIQKRTFMAIVVTLCGVASSVTIADDLFLKVDGVPGDSRDAGHPNEIVLQSYKTGVVQSKTTRNRSVNAEAVDLTVVAYANRATPTLYAIAANGTRIQSVVLSVRPPPTHGTPQYNLEITLRDALVTSVNLSGAAGSERATDTYSFGGYSQIEIEYLPIGAGGEPGTPVNGGWDISNNRRE